MQELLRFGDRVLGRLKKQKDNLKIDAQAAASGCLLIMLEDNEDFKNRMNKLVPRKKAACPCGVGYVGR